MPEFTVVTPVDATPHEAFELSLSVDAHTASMARSGERAVGGVTAGILALGDQVTWRARHFGVPFTMTSRITEHDVPHRFVDEQVRGPFGRWWHEHRFEPTPDGRCLMTDTIRFASPLGPLGALVDRLVLRRYMERLIRERNEHLATTLAG